MNQKRFINTALVVLITILIGTTGYFFLKKKSAVPTEQTQLTDKISSQQTVPTDKYDTINQSSIIVPPLFTDVRWQEVPFDSSRSWDFQMKYDNFEYVKNPAEKKEKFIQLPGHLWIANVKNLSSSELNKIRENFIKYYDDSLYGSGSGWGEKQNFNSKQISFYRLTADGVLGSSWSYLKIQNEKLRLVGMSYSAQPIIEKESPMDDITCPCTLELNVFVSDEISVSSFSL